MLGFLKKLFGFGPAPEAEAVVEEKVAETHKKSASPLDVVESIDAHSAVKQPGSNFPFPSAPPVEGAAKSNTDTNTRKKRTLVRREDPQPAPAAKSTTKKTTTKRANKKKQG